MVLASAGACHDRTGLEPYAPDVSTPPAESRQMHKSFPMAPPTMSSSSAWPTGMHLCIRDSVGSGACANRQAAIGSSMHVAHASQSHPDTHRYRFRTGGCDDRYRHTSQFQPVCRELNLTSCWWLGCESSVSFVGSDAAAATAAFASRSLSLVSPTVKV